MFGLVVTDAKKWEEARHYSQQMVQKQNIRRRWKWSTAAFRGLYTPWTWRWASMLWPNLTLSFVLHCRLLILRFVSCQAVSLSKEGSTAKGLAEKLSTMPPRPKCDKDRQRHSIIRIDWIAKSCFKGGCLGFPKEWRYAQQYIAPKITKDDGTSAFWFALQYPCKGGAGRHGTSSCSVFTNVHNTKNLAMAG